MTLIDIAQYLKVMLNHNIYYKQGVAIIRSTLSWRDYEVVPHMVVKNI